MIIQHKYENNKTKVKKTNVNVPFLYKGKGSVVTSQKRSEIHIFLSLSFSAMSCDKLSGLFLASC